MRFTLFIVFILVGLYICVLGAVHDAQQLPKTITLYVEKPNCPRPVSISLPSNWNTPFESGVTAWICR